MKVSKKKLAAGLAAGALAVTAGGVAYAYWTASGNGTGSGSTGTATDWDVSSTTDGGPLQPGVDSADQTVHVTIKNVGDGDQAVNGFTISVANDDASAWTYTAMDDSVTPAVPVYPGEDACSDADFALGDNTAAGSFVVNSTVDPTLPNDLAPGASYTFAVNLHMLDTNQAQDNCQGLADGVPLYIAAS